MTVHPTIALLGTGLMGLHQARNLLRAGFPLTAWNRTRARAEPLVPDGARFVDAAPEAVAVAEIVALMLENGPVVEQVMFGADPAKVREALRGGFAESRVLELHGQRMVERDFVTKGRSVMHLKDLDNALDAAGRLGLAETPFTAATVSLFRGLLDHAGDLDHSGLLVELERRNGVPN